MNFEKFLEYFNQAKALKKNFVVVTLVNAKGSAPQEVGARLIANSDGYFAGTIGGGKLEKKAIEKSQEFLKENMTGSHFFEWNLQSDILMSCGGVVGLFFEVHNFQKIWDIVIFGAGHVSQELIRVLLRLECQLTCVDSRPEWLEKLPQDTRLSKVQIDPMDKFVPEISPDAFVVSASMGHSTDLPILAEIFKTKNLPYVGAIGSDIKAKKLKENLRELQIQEDKIRSLHCPVGEDIGNNTPAEIAISIAAQLLKVRGI